MNKCIKYAVSFSLCFLLAFMFTLVVSADSDMYGIITGDSLNVRKSPSTSAEILTQLNKGVKVDVLDYSDGWYKINTGSITGWVYEQFITVKDPAVSTGTVKADILNVRETPSTSAAILGKLYQGDTVTVMSESDGWYEIKYQNGKAWVSAEYVVLKNAILDYGTITGSNVNFRANPSLSAEIITTLNKGDKVSIYDRYEEWYRVKTEDDILGWVHSDYVAIRGTEISRGGSSSSDSGSKASSLGAQIVEYAKRFLGVKYVYGGSTPNGFDCSGFVQYVYANFGIKINRVAADQAKQGTKVSMSNLRAGDLVFFDTDGGHNYINHVGIYIGNGQFIHASSGSSAKKVVISNLFGGFYENTYMTARRFFD